MDELNKRIIEIMARYDYTKSAFAAALDVSLPLITHITTGRNKPGLDIIQKILTRFEEVSPDWLLVGKGQMNREKPKKQDFTAIYSRLDKIEAALKQPLNTNEILKNYHKILIDEVLYLKEMNSIITDSHTSIEQIQLQIQAIKQELNAE